MKRASSSNRYPALMEAAGVSGGGYPVEPGASTVSKTVTITFELK